MNDLIMLPKDRMQACLSSSLTSKLSACTVLSMPFVHAKNCSVPTPGASFRTMLFTRTNLPVRLAHRYRGFASQDGSFSIPVVNFSKFRLASSPKEKQQTAGEIVSAFKKSGFIYLSNHGIETCRSSR